MRKSWTTMAAAAIMPLILSGLFVLSAAPVAASYPCLNPHLSFGVPASTSSKTITVSYSGFSCANSSTYHYISAYIFASRTDKTLVSSALYDTYYHLPGTIPSIGAGSISLDLTAGGTAAVNAGANTFYIDITVCTKSTPTLGHWMKNAYTYAPTGVCTDMSYNPPVQTKSVTYNAPTPPPTAAPTPTPTPTPKPTPSPTPRPTPPPTSHITPPPGPTPTPGPGHTASPTGSPGSNSTPVSTSSPAATGSAGDSGFVNPFATPTDTQDPSASPTVPRVSNSVDPNALSSFEATPSASEDGSPAPSSGDGPILPLPLIVVLVVAAVLIMVGLRYRRASMR